MLVARRPATPEHVKRIDAELRALARTYPEGVGYLHVVDSRKNESRRVSDETRRAFVELARNAPPEARCVGIALLADGFIAAAMRGVVAAAVAALRARVPIRVFGAVSDTCSWIEETYRAAGLRIAPHAELARAVEDVRARITNR